MVAHQAWAKLLESLAGNNGGPWIVRRLVGIFCTGFGTAKHVFVSSVEIRTKLVLIKCSVIQLRAVGIKDDMS